MATDLLERIRSEIDERLAQLRPLLSEYERLTAAAETLAAVDATPLAAAASPPPPAAVDAADATPYADAPYTERRYARPAREVPEFPTESPARSTEAPQQLPAEAPPVDAEDEHPAQAPRRTYPLRGADGAIKLAMSLRTTPLQRPTPKPAQPAASAPSATQVLERPAPTPSTVEEDTWELSTPDSKPAREPASPTAVRQAILAALEHGSHTASELVMVTAMSAPEIRGGLIRLTGRGSITKVKRRGDGKTAYALPFSRA